MERIGKEYGLVKFTIWIVAGRGQDNEEVEQEKEPDEEG